MLEVAERTAGPDLEGELQQQQLETNSRPCQSLEELHRELRRCRASAAAAAGRAGAQVAALAPFRSRSNPSRSAPAGMSAWPSSSA